MPRRQKQRYPWVDLWRGGHDRGHGCCSPRSFKALGDTGLALGPPGSGHGAGAAPRPDKGRPSAGILVSYKSKGSYRRGSKRMQSCFTTVDQAVAMLVAFLRVLLESVRSETRRKAKGSSPITLEEESNQSQPEPARASQSQPGPCTACGIDGASQERTKETRGSVDSKP